MAGAELILLKFRDLNSSASVMLGGGVCVYVGVWVGSSVVCNRLQGLYDGCADGVYVFESSRGCRGVGLTTGGC
jgi:hypothetical protein